MTTTDPTVHDFTDTPVLAPHRPDPLVLVRTLPGRFEAVGLADVLVRANELLERSEALAEQSREEQQKAQAALTAAMLDLGAGRISLPEVAAVTRETEPWVGSVLEAGKVAPAQSVTMKTVDLLRSQAVQSMTLEASTLYTRLQPVCADAVAVIASGPRIPNSVFTAPDPDKAAVATSSDFAHWWVTASAAATRFEEVHSLARVLRDGVGGLGALTLRQDGCPNWAAGVYRNWEKAFKDDGLALLKTTKSMVCRIRLGVDNGWEPGLWTAQDLVTQPAPKAGLLQRLTGG